MNLSEITVKKKETNELVTRIFEDEERNQGNHVRRLYRRGKRKCLDSG